MATKGPEIKEKNLENKENKEFHS